MANVIHDLSKNTKVVCTIGPASDNKETLINLIKNGMNIARLNFSHGDYESHLAKIKLIQEVEKELNITLPILLDTKGPEIRVGLVENDAVQINEGSKVTISMDNSILGNSKLISVSYPNLINDVEIGNVIRIDDGNLGLKINEIDKKNKCIICKAQNTHLLKSRKGVNVSGAKISMNYISPKDEADIKFGCENGVDAIAASFTRTKKDILEIKKLTAKYGKPDLTIIAKIENQEGYDNFEDILTVADGIMVARGDLGVEVPPEEVPIYQEHMIEKARMVGKIVITATQMLESMVKLPRPTRAEVSDVALAIYQSTDCIMLSAESASGLYPIKATHMMEKIAKTIEAKYDHERFAVEAYETSLKNNSDAIANSVTNTANLIGANLIICFSQTGNSAKRISKNRPSCPIICVTNNENALNLSSFAWGVYPHKLNSKMPEFIEEMEVVALHICKKLGVPSGASVIITGGIPAGADKTNFMKIIQLKNQKRIEL